MRDVSLRAGVSRMTVSRVFIRPDEVALETRERVREAVRALGYVPNRAAGGLVTRRTGFVGVILPTLVNGNFAALAEGLTETLRPAGFELLVGTSGYSGREEEQQVRTVLSRRPEAVILAASAPGAATRHLLAESGVPVIEVAGLPERPIGHAIGFSNHDAGAAAARFLIGLGHRRIAALGPAGTPDRRDRRGEARLAGFGDTLRDAGLPTDLIRPNGTIPFSFTEGARAMAELVRDAPDIGAVFAVSDLAAVGALMECRRQGIDVPGRISVLGFGDFEIGRQVVPALSTIAVDFADIGRRAGRRVAGLVGPDAPAPDPHELTPVVDVGFSVVARESTGRATP